MKVKPGYRQQLPLQVPAEQNYRTKGDDRFWPPPEMKIGEEYNPMQDWRGRL